MKNLIISALDKAYKQSVHDAPKIKYNVLKSEDINGMSVNQLLSFIKEKNIDQDALVSVDTESSDVHLSVNLNLYIKIPLTEEEREYAVRGIFDRYAAMNAVRNILQNNGYKTKNVDRDKFKDFNYISVYDMYMANNFDLLVDLYSLFFDKE